MKPVRARWREVILVCAKCEKKLDGGFGANGDARLSRLLAKAAGGKGPKAAWGVAPTRCLKLCPKRAVAVVRGGAPAHWLTVPAGTPLAEVMAELGLVDPAPSARST